MQADKQTEMHVYTHTHTHSKNVSAALGSLQAVGVDTNCIIVSHWNGIRLYQSVTQRDTADMTSDAAIKLADSGIYIWTLPLIWRGGGAKMWTSVTAGARADSLSVSHSLYPTVFFSCIVWNSSFFLLYPFSHNLSGSLIVKLPACSCALLRSPTIIYVWFCL